MCGSILRAPTSPPPVPAPQDNGNCNNAATELEAIGAAEVQLTPHGYVLATISGHYQETRSSNGRFPRACGHCARFLGQSRKAHGPSRYRAGASGFRTIRSWFSIPLTTPELRAAVGKDIVTASGQTLLGADDKAGVAVMMTLADYLI